MPISEGKLSIGLNKKFIESLSNKLEALSDIDERCFYPHKFDLESIIYLRGEKGSHYYSFAY